MLTLKSFSWLKFKRLYVSLILIAFVLPSCTQLRLQRKTKVDSYIEMGKSYLKHKNYPKSFEAFLKAKDLDPKNPLIFNHLGLAHFQKGKYHLAEREFKTALKLDKNYTIARVNLGELFLAMGLTQLAIQVLTKASQDLTYPNPEKVSLNLGMAHLIQKDLFKAQDHFEEALMLSPKDCAINLYYGRLLFEQKKYQKALLHFNKSENFCKKNLNTKDEIFYYKALCYFQSNQKEKAKTLWNKILENSVSENYIKKAKKMLKLTF